MVIALLALLGVDLIVIVVLLGIMLSRLRWVSHQPGAFKGAIRVVDGEAPGWEPSGSAAMAAGSAICSSGPRRRCCSVTSWCPPAAEPGEVKRVGSDPMIVPLAADGGARVEVAAAGDDRGRALGLLAVSAPSPSR